MKGFLAILLGLAAAAVIYVLLRWVAKQPKPPIEIEGSGDPRTPSSIIEFPDTFTDQQVEDFRKAWIEASSHPTEMVLLSRQYGVRYRWESGATDDLQFPSREEAEAAIAESDEATTLLVRTVKQRMPEYGPWMVEADTFTVNLTELLAAEPEPTKGEPS